MTIQQQKLLAPGVFINVINDGPAYKISGISRYGIVYVWVGKETRMIGRKDHLKGYEITNFNKLVKS